LAQAQTLARELSNQAIDLPHLVAVLLRDPQDLPARLVGKAGGDPAAIYQAAQTEMGRLPKVSGSEGGQYLSNRLNAVFSRAEALAKELGDRYVAVDTLTLALAETGYAGLPSVSALRAAIQEIRGGRKWTARTQKVPIKPSSNTVSTSPPWPNPANSTR